MTYARTSQRATVRRATLADHLAIHQVLRAAFGQYRSTLSAETYARYLTDLTDLEARRRAAELLVAERAGRVVGTVTFFPDASNQGFGWPSGCAGVRALGVAPGERGGVGRLLMEECVRRAEDVGATALTLHTADFMTAAIALYERLGFEHAPAFDVEVGHLAGGEDHPIIAIAYVKPLSRQVRFATTL
jgi:predicted N-acetyltransferase YhbS